MVKQLGGGVEMNLKDYKTKRDFRKSPEPTGGKPKGQKLAFVVQMHKATRLHYDFRLELNGVLVSWAVPKQPTADSSVKRLAIKVEDHPYDYRNFEGIIPSGYGAGTVMVWDTGTYEIAGQEGKTKRAQQAACKKGLASGKLHLILYGKKLQGEFALVHTGKNSNPDWLLFYVGEKVSKGFRKKENDLSVVSGKTLDEIKNNPTEKYKSKSEKKETSKSVKPQKGSLPGSISPMLATLVRNPFHDDNWQYEIKWDGYRALAFCNGEKVNLKSRNDKSFNERFEYIVNELKKCKLRAVFDGEIVAVDDQGKADFGALQNWKSPDDGPLLYYIFDLLWLDGYNLMEQPLSERRTLLEKYLPESSHVRFSENFEINGIELFESVKRMGLEGLVAKKADSIYNPGVRSPDWLKIKALRREDAVIGGYTLKSNSPNLFSSLLLGMYRNGKLQFTGKAGTGFNQTDQQMLMRKFKRIEQKKSPFENESLVYKTNRFGTRTMKDQVFWLKPELICEVTFTEITSDGVMRHPSFQGLRTDKSPKEVTMKNNLPEAVEKKSDMTKSAKFSDSKSSGEKKIFTSGEDTIIRKINGAEIKFSNLTKIYWPKKKITKGHLLDYYEEISEYILPYLKNRPQSLNRHPNGVAGKSFYFKDVTDIAPYWVETFDYTSEQDGEKKKYLVAKNKASLLYMATLGCIEMNPWHSRVGSEDFPDYCIIDLDPGDTKFEKVIDAANIVKGILDNWGVESFPKTSGSTGIHVYIPLGAKYTYDQSKEFGRVIATLVQQEMPRYTTIERTVKQRKGKMYIDFLQNRSHATVAAPYSLRPKSDATVSMPLEWDEVKKGLKMTDFTIFNALERVRDLGDIFKPVLGKGINLKKIINQINK